MTANWETSNNKDCESFVLNSASNDSSMNNMIATTSEAIERVKDQIRLLDEQMNAKRAAQIQASENVFGAVAKDIGNLSDGSASIVTRLSVKSHQLLSRLKPRRVSRGDN